MSQKEFTKNILTLMTGTTVAQAIPILISPLLTRIYTPQDFGVFAVFFASSIIFGGVVTGKYEFAIMLPRKEEDAINIFTLGLLINLVLSLSILFFIMIFSDNIVAYFGYTGMNIWLYFIPFSVFFIGLFNLLNYFNNRKKYFKDISKSMMIKAVVLGVVQLLIGLLSKGFIGLILGELFSRIFANMKLIKNVLKEKALISSISKIKIWALAKKYKNFPFYNLPSTLANVGASYLPLLILPKVYGLSIGGHFMLAQNIISLPAALIAKAFSQVLFQKMSENKKLGRPNLSLLLSTIKKLLIIGLPIGSAIFFFSPLLFGFIFGKEWELAGEIAQFLSVVFVVTFVTSTVSVTLLVYNELKVLATWQFSYLFTSTIIFGILFLSSFELKEFLFYFTIHEIILYIIYLFIIIKTVVKMDIRSK